MTIAYSSTRREIATWYWYSLRRNRKHLRAWILSLLAVSLLVFISERQSGTTSVLTAISVSLVAAVGLAVFFMLYPQLRFKPQERTLTIAPDGLSTTINTHSKSYRWTELASITEDHDHVYIGLTSVNAFVVPSRAFSSAERRQEFVRQCRVWRQAAGGPGT